jgi:hypothetical protein
VCYLITLYTCMLHAVLFFLQLFLYVLLVQINLNLGYLLVVLFYFVDLENFYCFLLAQIKCVFRHLALRISSLSVSVLFLICKLVKSV